nr:MAG TPA: hypothetical protein [Caudoviricetes sp.]
MTFILYCGIMVIVKGKKRNVNILLKQFAFTLYNE